MILYNAGLFTSNFDQAGRVYAQLTPEERAMRDGNRYYLESYHYCGKESVVKKIKREKRKVFLDSGAFSAFTQNATIDLGRYCDYCHRNADIIEIVSVLDLIDFDDPKAAAKGSYKNLMEMKRRGVEALPCYHQGEPPEVLEWYVQNYSHITLGGLVGSSTQKLMLWLDELWGTYLTNADGTPKIKIHGFGITSLPIMLRYPWYSVDSSTWVQWSANGMILLPERGEQLNISARSSSRKLKDQHIDSLAPTATAALEAEIKRHNGDPQRLRDFYGSRWAWNCWAFPKYVEMRGGGVSSFKPSYDRLFGL